MKSERRHELKENELAKDLGKAGEFIKRNLSWIIGGLLAVVLVIALGFYVVGQRRANREGQWRQYHSLVSGQEDLTSSELRGQLRDLARSTSQDDLAAWANVQAGNLAYREMMIDYPELDDAARQAFAEEIEQSYRQVLTRYGNHEAQAAQAHLGLGLLAETERNFDEAARQYQRVAEISPPPQMAGRRASERLTAIEALRQPLVFADVPAVEYEGPETEAIEQPVEPEQDMPAEAPAE